MLSQTHRLSFWVAINTVLSLAMSTAVRAEIAIVSCEGFGADHSLSVKQANDQCRSIAADKVKGSSFKVKQLSFQTNGDSEWFSEISNEADVRGLVCDQISEHTEQLESGEYHTDLKCRFDLSKARIVPSDVGTEQAGIIMSESRQITLWTVPACSHIYIRGKKPRSIKCKNSPQTIRTFKGEDKEMTVVAKGYRPETISLTMDKEVINVLFFH